MSEFKSLQPDEQEYKGHTLEIHRNEKVNKNKVIGVDFWTAIIIIKPGVTRSSFEVVVGLGLHEYAAVSDGVAKAKRLIDSDS